MRRAFLIGLLLVSVAQATTTTTTTTTSTSTVVSEPVVQRQFIAWRVATASQECAAVKTECAAVLALPSQDEYEAALGRQDWAWLKAHPRPDFPRRQLCELARGHCQALGVW